MWMKETVARLLTSDGGFGVPGLRGRRVFLLMVAGLHLALPAHASLVNSVNEVRMSGCPGSAGGKALLHETPRLSEAARRLARGEALPQATRKAGYRAVNSASVQVTNVPDDHDVVGILARRFCAQVTAADFKEIGTYRRGSDVFLIMAAPFVAPTPRDRPAVEKRVLELTNEARSHGRRCGSKWFQAAPPLVPAPAPLGRAAAEHSNDMARHDYMDHTGRDGSSPAERITRAGYRWRVVGENLASGVLTPEDVVRGWVGSPHHCENLMDPRFTQMAVAYAVNPDSGGGIYWTQLFGTP